MGPLVSPWKCFATVALLCGGCGRNLDPPVRPEPAQRAEADVVVVERPPGQPAAVDPVRLREDALDALDAGDLDAAFRLVRAARAATPDDPETLFLMARVLAERNRFAEAIKMLDDLAVAVPELRLPALGQTAEWSVLQGEWQEAEQRYRTLLSEVGPASMINRMLAQLLLRQGRRLEAARYLRQLCTVGDIGESELRSLLILAHPFAGEPAEDEFEPIGALGQARYQISQGNWDDALDRLEGATAPAEVALRGRIYAEQPDDEALRRWVASSGQQEQETSDYWFAMGVDAAHRNDHRRAVSCFAEVVLRDQTDHRAYELMGQSLDQLGMTTEAEAASKRAELIQQTQSIGSEMAASETRDVQMISTLAGLLDELQRPLEAIAWRAVQIYYGQRSSAISAQAAAKAMEEINRDRLARLQADEAEPDREFLLCGIDLETWNQ